jgi:ParB family transcriptional regulator, chromosome partitioning protein
MESMGPAPPQEAVISIQKVRLDAIVAGDNDRTEFQAGELEALAQDIAAHGLAQPITVRPVSGRGRPYEIVAGERRYRAHLLLQQRDPAAWHSIDALVRPMSDQAADAIMLAENLHRKDLNPLDEAKAYRKRMEKHGWSVAEVAAAAHVSAERVRNRLLLLNLMPEYQVLVQYGNLDLGKAQHLGTLDKNHQMIAMRALLAKPMTNDNFVRICARLRAQQDQLAMWDLSLFEKMSDEELVEHLQEEPLKTSVVAIPSKDGTMYLVVEHAARLVLDVDLDAIASSVRLVEKG